jgi:hypothetical protein
MIKIQLEKRESHREIADALQHADFTRCLSAKVEYTSEKVVPGRLNLHREEPLQKVVLRAIGRVRCQRLGPPRDNLFRRNWPSKCFPIESQ